MELCNTTIILLSLPLLVAGITACFGKFLGKCITNSIIMLLFITASVLASYILYGFITNSFSSIDITLYDWGKVGNTTLQVGFLLDQLSAFMLVVVSYIASMVHIYSIYYMRADLSYYRFFSYLSFFTFAMFVLIVANNFLQLFFAWEMVGLASYLLIGFWFTSNTAVSAGFKALVINRISDIGFLVGILIIFYYFNSLNYHDVFIKIPQFAATQTIMLLPGLTTPVINVICVLLLIGVLGKSAQLPFSSWLPDSMVGPLPVSALIHSATMVAAGVFMIARVAPLFELSLLTLNIMLVIGIVTCVAMGLVAVVVNDIKQVLAYATISQLGFMLVALGTSSYTAGILHLATHAFFKTLLFLAAGIIIINSHGQQDLRKMTGVNKQRTFIYAIMLIASLAAVGFPGLSGFYAKELILAAIKNISATKNVAIYYTVLFSVFITSLYTFRMFFLLFYGETNNSNIRCEDARQSTSDYGTDNIIKQENNNSIQINNIEQTKNNSIRINYITQLLLIKLPLVVLAIFCISLGWINIGLIKHEFLQKLFYVQFGNNDFTNIIQENYSILKMPLRGFLSLSFWLTVAGGIVAWVHYVKKPKLSKWCSKALLPIYFILAKQYWLNTLNKAIVIITRWLGQVCLRSIEQFVIEGIIVNSIKKCILLLANILRKLQTGYVYHYIFVMIAGLVILLWWLLLKDRTSMNLLWWLLLKDKALMSLLGLLSGLKG